ncbi:nucleoside deaminase [Arthrobacter sp. NIO-1057]|uniref:nucleoside deaminase n=1 Tax=Arthrobacter sp. NIO-1057 TaxID=993071 RepID=UPI0008175FC5|nr:nucleoside deaminase [Arthrobacter sp. NIO-1057]SCC51813.1 cytosine deaminase [Arthrobacter sp. NIO-1057]
MSNAFSAALQAAKDGQSEAGIPIGAALAHQDTVIATGYNRRLQDADPTAHAEISALRAAGRRTDYQELTLYTTLAPCALCSGAIVQFKIPRVVIGEASSFPGEIDWLRSRGVQVQVLNDPEATELMAEFIVAEPQLWNEDIAHTPSERTTS